MPEYTVKEYAVRERVTQRTVYNWMSKGAVPFRRTPGGGIRIPEDRESTLVVFDMKDIETSGNRSA